MLFLTLNNVDIQFAEREFVQKTYSATKALSTIERIESIDKKEFTAAVLNKEDKTFVIHISAFSMGLNVHLSRETQIALLDIKKISIFFKYADYTNVFSPDFAAELPEQTSINDHFIDLINDKQLPYSSIYSLGLVELETLKTFIKINLANSFIRAFKLPTNALILFIRKKDNNFQLYVNY